jgi:hypothetical protein
MPTKADAEVDAKLLDKINAAVKSYNTTEKTVATAQAEHASRGRALGLLLLEAKKLHPKVQDFDAFLKKAKGLPAMSRAYDLMKLAGGRVSEADLKKDAAERKQKSRANAKKNKPTTKPATKPDVSVTDPNVTETAEASADKRKAENATAVDDAEFTDPTTPAASAATDQSKMADTTAADTTAQSKMDKASDLALREFKIACDIRLPKMTAADLEKAELYCVARATALTVATAPAQKKAA